MQSIMHVNMYALSIIDVDLGIMERGNLAVFIFNKVKLNQLKMDKSGKGHPYRISNFWVTGSG